MGDRRRTQRLAAAAIAASALFGLAVQFAATFAAQGSVLATVWILLRYFTIVANLAAAAFFAGRALAPERFASPALRGGLLLTLLLVAVVYQALLYGTMRQTGLERLADLFLHRVTPALVVLDWALLAPKGSLRWRDPLRWAVLPILYLVYALVRGGADGIYPYPFLDVGRFGAAAVLANAALIAAGFMTAGLALVALDRGLARRRRA